MIDSHCHLDHSPLYEKLDQIVNRAESSGVECLLTISTTLRSFEMIKRIILKYKNIYGSIGIHPHETKNHINVDKKKLILLRNENNKIIGIGETGLDYYYQNSNKLIQKKKFVEHIEAAIDLDLPIIVHSRNAEIDTFRILNDFSRFCSIFRIFLDFVHFSSEIQEKHVKSRKIQKIIIKSRKAHEIHMNPHKST